MKKRLLPVFLVFSISVACILGCGTSTSTEKTGTTTKVEEKEEEIVETKAEPVIERYKIGDVVKISTDDGDYEICFTGVTETDDRNQFEESNPNRVVLISYEYKNIDYSGTYYDGSTFNEISLNSWDLSVYDAEGNVLDTYPATLDFGKAVTPGHKGTGTVAYGLNSDTNYLEVEYSADLFSSYSCVFDLEW